VTLRVKKSGFSLVEMMLALGIGALVMTAAGSLMVYFETHHTVLSREAKMAEIMQLVKMNLNDYRTCSANVYLAALPENGTAQLHSIDYYSVNPANPNAAVPTNMMKSSNLIAVGQLADDVKVTGIRLEGKGYINSYNDGTTTLLADLVVTFDPRLTGVTEERRLPLQLQVYRTTNAVSACTVSATTGAINLVTLCEISGQTFNPSTGSCGGVQQATWYYGNPDATTCPAGWAPSPFVNNQTDRCACKQPRNFNSQQICQKQQMSDGSFQTVCAPNYRTTWDATANACDCIYAQGLVTTKWKAGIECVQTSAN